MKSSRFWLIPAFCIILYHSLLLAATPQFPGTRLLESGDLVVEVGDPNDPTQRWNNGLRFSPVANVIQVKLMGRTFCYAPQNGGSLGYAGGLAMEFDIGQEDFEPDPPGYNQSRVGDPFLKIGVGILQRTAGEYRFNSGYPIVELAKTTATWEKDRVHFVQSIEGTANGYAYGLEVDVVAKNDTLFFHYLLTNTGTKTFTTEQYLHNFLAPSHLAVGPNYRVTFPYDFTVTPDVPLWEPPHFVPASGRRGGPVLVDDNPARTRLENTLQYTDRISGVPKIWVYKPDDYLGPDSFILEQTRTGQSVVIDCSLRSESVGIWSTNYNISPEQFVRMTLAPGEEVAFTRSYRFSNDGSLAQDCTGDRIVNHRDLASLSESWLNTPESPNWNPSCDISTPGDDVIDNSDVAALGQQWQRDPANPVPVALWALDEASGLVAADQIGASHGALIGFDDDDSQWVAGKADGALQFDGTDDSISVENNSLPAGRQERTVMAWVKAPQKTNSLPIIAWGSAETGDSWLVEIDAEQRLRVTTRDGFVSTGDVLIGDDNWHHIAVVLDSADPQRPLISDIALYIDGDRRKLHRMMEADIDTAANGNIHIGTGPQADSGFYMGILDNLTVYDVVVGPGVIRRAAR